MNIHFEDEKLFNTLMESSLLKIEIGSSFYGLNNENSDKDFLIIYANGKINNEAFLTTYHQLQYKKDNVDYDFCSLQQFIQNILNGDSTINYEVLDSGKLKNTVLSFIDDNINAFKNYNIIKGYLGIASRDLKAIKKKGHYSGKKAAHFVRGVLTAETILYGYNVEEYVYKDNIELLRYLKNDTKDIEEVKDILIKYESIMKERRNELNELLNARKIEKDISADNAYKLNKLIYEFCNSDFYKSKQKEFIDLKGLVEYGQINQEYGY